MKRFWDEASVVAVGDRFSVRLDGRPMRLPGGPVLLMESLPLAQAIAAEWQQAGGAKGGSLTAEDVPLTRLAGTAQERVAIDPGPTIAALARYAETDLLCYRATTPAVLVSRQALRWQPWLDWADRTYGASFALAEGIMPVGQPPATLAALRRVLAGLPPFVLAGLGVLVPATGSLVLGLAVEAGALDAAAASDLALLDEIFEIEQWGEDAQAAIRLRAVTADIAMAAWFIALSQCRAAADAPRSAR